MNVKRWTKWQWAAETETVPLFQCGHKNFHSYDSVSVLWEHSAFQPVIDWGTIKNLWPRDSTERGLSVKRRHSDLNGTAVCFFVYSQVRRPKDFDDSDWTIHRLFRLVRKSRQFAYQLLSNQLVMLNCLEFWF